MPDTHDADQRLSALRERLAAATRERIRAEHSRDAARAAADKARATLAEQFGVATVDEARAKLHQLTGELNRTLIDLESDLDRIGA